MAIYLPAFYADLFYWKSTQVYFNGIVHRQKFASSSSGICFLFRAKWAQMAAPLFHSACPCPSADGDNEMSLSE